MSEQIYSDEEMDMMVSEHSRCNTQEIDVAKLRKDQRQVIFVIDDDPTGTQTVHDVPVLTLWTPELIAREVEEGETLLFILSNSRSLPPAEAMQINREIGDSIKKVCLANQIRFVIISRSDSTLRGHYPDEVLALKASVGHPHAVEFLIPAFFEGGRITVNDVHYVKEADQWIPAAQTPFAKDKVFGYHHSDLKQWLREKSGGKITSDQIRSLSLEELCAADQQKLIDRIERFEEGTKVVVNAAQSEDLMLFVAAVLQIPKFFLYRTAASFVSVMAAQSPRAYLRADEVIGDPAMGGLIVIGSYVPKTTSQLAYLKTHFKSKYIEIDVRKFLDGQFTPAQELGYQISQHLQSGDHVIVATSRDLIAVASEEQNLSIGQAVSDYLIELLKNVRSRPKYILTKGGITSSDIATKALAVQRAWVMGQLIPGVAVWKTGKSSKFPGLCQIVFPGNVGDDAALWSAIDKLEF